MSKKFQEKKLTPEQFHILKEKGTEPAFSGKFHDNKKTGMYTCAGCGEKLFSSEKKFDSGTGWPSFTTPVKDSVDTAKDFKLVLPRTEVLCKTCKGHLGHLFNDGPEGKRYCINSGALNFKEK